LEQKWAAHGVSLAEGARSGQGASQNRDVGKTAN
jgi:hypothetical protein